MTESQITDAIELLQFPYLESKGGGEVMKGIEIGVRAMVGMVEWIELKEGNDLPDYDEYVLWLSDDGSIHWDALDKDGNDHIFKGYKIFEDGPLIKTTHWRRIEFPEEYNKK